MAHFRIVSLILVLLVSGNAAQAANRPPPMSIPGQFGVNSTGAATYSIPISVSPGTSGIVPSLSLSYSSQSADSFVGLGWSLGGLPSITRCSQTLAQDNAKGSVNYSSNDRFCMSGKRLMLVSGTGAYGADGSEYRTEVQSYTKIVAHGSSGSGPAWFEVRTRDGQRMQLGATADSQALVIPAVSGTPPTGTVREWHVNRVSDTSNNYLTVTYSCAPNGGSCVSGEAYPTRIDYTGNSSAGVSPYNSVRFEYSARGDSVPLYQAGGVVQPGYVLTHIKTYEANNMVLDYLLSYRSGTSTLRSRLEYVRLCNASSVCLPDTAFAWQGGGNALSMSSTGNNVGLGKILLPGDFNGDGLIDLEVVGSTGCSAFPTYLAPNFTTPSGSVPNPGGSDTSCTNTASQALLSPSGTVDNLVTTNALDSGSNPVGYVSAYRSLPNSNPESMQASSGTPAPPTLTGDYNGDGIPDVTLLIYPLSRLWVGMPGGGYYDTGDVSNIWQAGGNSSAVDFDGDGCTDWYIPPNAMASGVIYLNCSPVYSSVAAPQAYTYGTTFGDFNGDGKTDILGVGSSDTRLWLSTGTGFVLVNSSLPVWSGNNIKTGDWNGDGKADIILDSTSSGVSHQLFISTGTGFTAAVDGSGNPITIPNASYGSSVVADWNSDGAADFWIQTSSADTLYTFAYTPELMTAVSNGLGATTNIVYDRINKNGAFYTHTPFGGTYPDMEIDGPQYTVKQVATSNGLGTCNLAASTANCYQTNYSYAHAQTNLAGRGFLGFGQVVVTDAQTGIVQTTNYCTLFPLTGLVSSDTKVKSGVTLNSTVNTYNGAANCSAAASSGINVVNLTQSVVSGHDLNGATLPTTTTTYTYDSYGNALTNSISVSDGSSKIISNEFTNDTTNWILGLLDSTQVRRVVGSSDITRRSAFTYYSGTGLLHVESFEPGISTCNAGSDSCTLSTSYTYDAFGHRITSTTYGSGIADRTSYSFYDSRGQFKTSEANALGQYQFWGYDNRFGTPTSHMGPNFLTTTWSYDGFGRVALESRPDGTKTASSYSDCLGGCPTYGRFYATAQQFSSDGTTQIGPTSTSYFDMLSRSIATDAQGFDGSNTRVATIYDGRGNISQTSRPYFTASASPAWTTFTRDDLGRVTVAAFPDGSDTAYGYNGLTTTVTNDLGQVTTTVKNAQGLNYQVTDAASNTATFVYDAFDNPLTITDPAGNVVRHTYDVRGNRVASLDPDMGRWIYAYDVLAELTSQTDAKGQTTTLTYDVLGRALTRTEPGLYSEWTYGTSAGDRNVGQLIQAKACPTSGCSTVVSDKTFQFDSTGRPSQTYIKTATDIFGYKTTYNGTNGQMASVTYPSGLVVSRSYNSYGYLTQLTGPGSEVIWTGVARDAELHLTSQTAGNGVNTTQAFSSATGMIQNQRAGPSGAVASFDYAFDAIGNLTTRTDNSQPYTERFCYDSLNRLTNYNIGAACTGGKTVAYNAIGNITSKSDTGTYSYPSAGSNRPHAVSSITGTVDGLTNPSYSYDANGNLTCVSSGAGCSGTIKRTINLTSFNMAQSMIQGTNSLSLAYDDQHQRISQVNTVSGTTTTTTVYLNDPASGAMSERVSVSGTTPTVWNSFTWGTDPWGGTTANTLPTWTDYISVDGQIIAQRNIQYPQASAWGFQNWNSFNWGMPVGNLWNGFNWGAANWSGPVVNWAYFNLDHLGSVAVITDQGGNVTQRLSFDAWGKQRNANGTDVACGTISANTTRGFTNQEQMPAQCLVNLNARIYDASIGKFMAADTIVPNLYNGQSYNRYAYVRNSPLSLIDPTGHDEEVIVTGERGGNGFASNFLFGSGLSGIDYTQYEMPGQLMPGDLKIPDQKPDTYSPNPAGATSLPSNTKVETVVVSTTRGGQSTVSASMSGAGGGRFSAAEAIESVIVTADAFKNLGIRAATFSSAGLSGIGRWQQPLLSDDSQGGHDYRREGAVCRRRLSDAEGRDLMSRFSVPDMFAGYPHQNGEYLVALGPVPGGFITTTFSANGLSAINQTTPVHTFVGTIQRTLTRSEAGTSIDTHGFGNAGDGLVGQARDTLNQALGPQVFALLDLRARQYAGFNYPGCIYE